MLVYTRNKSGKLPRKTAKRTKPKFGDSFAVKSVGVPAFRSDKGKPKGKSAIAAFLKAHPVTDVVRHVPARTKERNEVLQLLEKRQAMAKAE